MKNDVLDEELRVTNFSAKSFRLFLYTLVALAIAFLLIVIAESFQFNLLGMIPVLIGISLFCVPCFAFLGLKAAFDSIKNNETPNLKYFVALIGHLLFVLLFLSWIGVNTYDEFKTFN